MQKFLQKLEGVSQALLDPLSYLTAAGLLLVVGALLTSSPLRQLLPVLNWTPIRLAGGLLYNSMMAIVNNLSIFLCVGIAAARTRTEKQEAALLALMAYLVFLTANHTTLEILGRLAESDGLTGLAATGQTSILGIQVMDTGVTGGILLGFAAAKIFDRTCETQFTGLVTQVYSGLRWSFLCIAAFAAAFGMAVCFVWPPLQEGIRAMTGWIAASGHAGIFLYGFLERLLIPTGLHHLIYMPFQFSALGGSMTVGSVTYTGAYMVTMAEYSYGLPLTDDVVWMYTGFTKTFGYLGIAAAFILTAKKERRKRTAAAILPLAVTASLASITEPVDFLFCFVSPVLWVLHAALAGGFMVLLNALQVRAFTSNLLGSLVFNLSAAPQQMHRVPLLYLLGVLEILTYAVVFSAIIRVFDLPTPGRAPERETAARQIDPEGIRRLLAALGGPGNICTVDNCFTRLRITVKDPDRLDTAALLAMPHKGLVQDGPYLQLVCGLQAAQVRRAVEQELEQCAAVWVAFWKRSGYNWSRLLRHRRAMPPPLIGEALAVG